MKLQKLVSLLLCLVLTFACFPLNAFALSVEDCTAGLSCGDLNESGNIDFKDVSLLIKYCAYWEVEINFANADVRKDDTVDFKDVSALIKYLAGWTNVRLGHLDDTEVIEEATCAVGGVANLVCRLCNSVVRVDTPVSSHSYVDGCCSHCGLFENGDGIAVPEIKDKSIDIGEATMAVYSSAIVEEDQVIVHSFTAEESGVYYAWVSSMLQGQAVTLIITDEEGYTVNAAPGCERDDGMDVTLEGGKTYNLEVKQNSGIGTCEVSLGMQTPTVDVTGCNLINDSIVFDNQQNNYEYVPAVSGLYRFWIKECQQGFEAALFVLDDEGYTVNAGSGYSRDDGIEVELTAGETYTFRVEQNGDHGAYTVAIGAQKPTVDISGMTTVIDSIQFEEQVNNYTFTVDSYGFAVRVRDITAGQELSIVILDENGYSVNAGSVSRVDDSIEVTELEEGKIYTICVRHNSGFGSYELYISRITIGEAC